MGRTEPGPAGGRAEAGERGAGGRPARSAADMQSRAGEAADLLKALANRNRLMLVCTLAEGEFSVGQLEERLGIRQPTLSQQLTVLRDGGIVETRREAKQVFYRLAAHKAALLVDALYAIFCADE